MPPLFTGVGVALVTLFDDDGRLDTAATADLAVQLTGLGMRSVLVAGTTGEAMSLSADERSALISAVRGAIPADGPVLAGTGAPTGAQAADLTTRAFAAGGDPALVLSPPPGARPRAGGPRAPPRWRPRARARPRWSGALVGRPAAGRPLLAYPSPSAASPG